MKKEYKIGILVMILASFFAAIGQYFFQLVSYQNNLVDVILFYLVGMFIYGFGFLCMMFSYRKIPLSVAHPLISFEYVFAVIISFLLLDEIIIMTQIFGILLIILGAYFLSLGLKVEKDGNII
ncbi:MAG: EamA family transporter [Candidatus Woesearchaeota archaeon]